MIKQAILNALNKLNPEMLQSIRATRTRRHIERFERNVGILDIQAKYFHEFDRTIRSGPFCGLLYLERSCGSSLLPKMIGSYEKELHDVITDAIDRKPRQVIDIGSAEGYYAVGLAMRLPSTPVLAFDTDPAAQSACLELAMINKVADRVTVTGRCDPELLQSRLTQGTFLVCDCEGFEYSIIEKLSRSSLSEIDLLVELHKNERFDPQVWFESVFENSHEVTIVNARGRTLLDEEINLLAKWSEEERLLAINEFRNDGFTWGYAKSKSWRQAK